MIDIAAQIPPWAKRVAELGVSREKAGEAFLRIQPQAEYWGITDDLAELQEAGKYLTHAAYALPEEVDFAKLGIYELDVLIIRGTYFRSLTAERLKAWTYLLSEEGQLLLEIPNPAYIRPYLEILAGKNNAQGVQGISAPAVGRLLAEAGLFTLTAQGNYDLENDGELRQSEESAALLGGLKRLLQKLGWPAEKDSDPWLKSFFFKAMKKPVETKDRILLQAIIGESIVTSRVRVHEPQGFLSTEPAVTSVAIDKKNSNALVPKGVEQKLLIRQRLVYTSVEQALAAIEGIRNDGYLAVIEIDDNPQPFEWGEAQRLSYLGTHAIQVSTEPLAEIMRQFNPHVKVFPNHLKELPEKRNYVVEHLQRLKEGEDYVTFFFGALNRTHEWQEVMPVICEAIEKYGSKLRFKVLSDKGFYEALPTEYKEFIGSDKLYGGQFVPYEIYTQALHSSDIAFLPLRDNDFNRTKSDLKFIESAGHGAVVLASPTVYEASVKDGRTGFIYRNPEEFREYLTLLIEDRGRRIETAEAAYNYVKSERLLSSHYLERLAWYRELLERKPELEREMVQRVREWQQAHPAQDKE